ncbi:MAG: tripartite tricarboxylate transporter substrate binding protein [Betaproteobacteria bacterium]|nr:tripartite tricarboxylate transporter substrate binding protein [Betaproteobacteria bacterium]
MRKLLPLVFLLPFAAAAQTYPSKPIRVVIPFGPGGATDVIARLVGQKVSEQLGLPIVFDNRPGANGNIGTEAAAKAPADGYTLVMSYDGTMAINPSVYRKMPFDPLKDLAPVASVAQLPLLMVVHPSVPAKSVAEFVALAKSRPGAINYSSAGYGSAGHLAAELFRGRAGIDLVHVNYKGGGQAVQDLVGGQIQMVMTGLTTVEGHLKGGKLRALAFTSPKRMAGAPEVPTFDESGFAGLVVQSWYGILAPAGTPADIVGRLNGEINKAIQALEVRARLAALGTEPTGGSAAEFGATIRADIARWAKVVEAAGIKID